MFFWDRLNNEKPSAIFRLRGAVEAGSSDPSVAGFQAAANVATLGLLIQDLPSLQQSTSNSLVVRSTQAAAPPNPVQLVRFT